MFCLVLAGCTTKIEVIGLGVPAPIQHGLEVKLVPRADGADLEVKNVGAEVVSVNVSPHAIGVEIACNGKPALPDPKVFWDIDEEITVGPDSFAILVPGQSREIAIPMRCDGKHLFHRPPVAYRLAKGQSYQLTARLQPYVGPQFTQKTAAKILAEFKIPNYLHETLASNTVTIQAK